MSGFIIFTLEFGTQLLYNRTGVLHQVMFVSYTFYGMPDFDLLNADISLLHFIFSFLQLYSFN